MTNGTVCCFRRSEAISHACTYLRMHGLTVSVYPTRNTKHLLLPVPSFSAGSHYLQDILPELHKDVVIYGGNLDIPLLQNYRTVDFLKDPFYLADNAAITASCAIELVESKTDLSDRPVLILGWGRIGKCLGKLLESKGSHVSIAARKPEDLAMIHALGYTPVQIPVDRNLRQYHVILNTVPAMTVPEMTVNPDAVILELASIPGMIGENIISARGLPGKMAPQKSGKLIADTFIRLAL